MIAQWHPKQELESLGAAKSSPPKRATRVADVIRNELSLLIVQRIRDPKLRDVNISRVTLSDDLRHAKIFYTSLQGKHVARQVQKRLVKAKGFMRNHLAKTLNLRFTPELNFWYDETVEKVEDMEKLLADIARKRDERESDS